MSAGYHVVWETVSCRGRGRSPQAVCREWRTDERARYGSFAAPFRPKSDLLRPRLDVVMDISADVLSRNPILRHGVAVANGDRAIFNRLAVHRNTERGADLVLPAEERTYTHSLDGTIPTVSRFRKPERASNNAVIKPQDILILLKLVATPESRSSLSALAFNVGVGLSEAHRSLRRSTKARLYDPEQRKPVLAHLREFVIHGVPYAFAAERGEVTRGIPTSFAAAPLNQHFRPQELASGAIPVWPSATGIASGYALAPLYPSVPEAAGRDPVLYELLALVDALRDGRARERNLAARELENRLAS